MSFPLPIRVTEETREKFIAIWLRLKTVDPALTQGEALEMALRSLERELHGKTVNKP